MVTGNGYSYGYRLWLQLWLQLWVQLLLQLWLQLWLQVVSGVKINQSKIFLSKSYPYNQICE